MTCDFCGDDADYRHVTTRGHVVYGPASLTWCRACLLTYYLGLQYRSA